VGNVTVQTFCTSGQAERVKGGVHAAAGAIVGVMAVYNAVAWWYRRERHLGWNTVIYGAGFAWELYQTSRHFRRPAHLPADRLNAPVLVHSAARVASGAEMCECGDGFCWCGGAEVGGEGRLAPALPRSTSVSA
jgi:hypothetical protein